MKKFLSVLACLIAFAGIITLCYFFGNPKGEIVILTGKYYLESYAEKTGEQEEIVTEYIGEDLYLEVYKGNKIKSFSGTIGFIGNEDIYTCEVFGTGLTIKLDGQTKYTGAYAEKLIVIEFSEKVTIDGEEQEKFVHYYYMLK